MPHNAAKIDTHPIRLSPGYNYARVLLYVKTIILFWWFCDIHNIIFFDEISSTWIDPVWGGGILCMPPRQLGCRATCLGCSLEIRGVPKFITVFSAKQVVFVRAFYISTNGNHGLLINILYKMAFIEPKYVHMYTFKSFFSNCENTVKRLGTIVE